MSSDTLSFSPTQRFWRLLQPDQGEIKNVYIYAIFNGLVYLSLPLGIQAIINLIQGGRINTSWIVLVFFVVLGVTLTGVLQVAQMRITENLQQKIFSRASFEFAYRIPRIKLEALYKKYAPELMNRFFDIMSVQKGLSKILIDFSTAVLNVIFGLVLLSFYHPFFILFSVVLIVLVFVLFRFTVKKGLETSLEESKYKYSVAHWLEEMARTGTTFKLAGETTLPLDRTDGYVGDYLKARENHFGVLIKQYYLMIAFKAIVATGLLAMGGILVMEQQMNIGQFVAAEIIILMVMSSVEKLFTSLETIYDVLTALEKIGQVTDLELESSTGTSLRSVGDFPGLKVDLNQVTFSYPESKSPSLKDITLSVDIGEKLAIAGHNGSGKSTLLYLMAGLYDVQEGNVGYNGVRKNALEPCSLRSAIGDYLMQEEIFDGTIYENIAMGRTVAKDEEVLWAAKAMGLGAYLEDLSQGIQTRLNPHGKGLPKSIIQKLLLARSIADKPKLLLLEDSLEHIELAERKRIIDFLTDKERPWTLVAATADRHFLESADRVAVLKNGEIAGLGTYQELKSQNLIINGHA